jgi:hypothetical protein
MRGARAVAVAAVVVMATATPAWGDARIDALRSSDPAARKAAVAELAKDGTPDDARALVAAMDGAQYATRGAITDAVTAMDDRAVAALVVAKRGKNAAARGWAAETLEAMGKERADAQIRTRSDALLVGILHAFGEARDPDALGVLSSYVSSDRAVARDAARAALLAYGGEAISKLRQDYADLTGQPAPAAWDAAQTAKELFAASDRLRLREVYALLDQGLAKARAGDAAGAVGDFDAVLARQPDLDRRVEVVSTYVDHAIAIEDADALGARLYLEKARRLAPDGPRVGQIDGELAFLEGRELESRGAPDAALYRQALALDPGNARARAALDRLEAAAVARAAKTDRWRAIAAGVVALILACVLFLAKARPAKPDRRN